LPFEQEGKSEVVDTTMADGPLGGIRIVDLTNVIMGPFATHIMADMGADVIKIESAEGDSFRGYRPNRSEGMAGGFLHLNRNKRSVFLDLKQADAMAALHKLIATADVFVHSLRPKAIEKLGLGYDSVWAIRPDIIYCGAYGFGKDGPYRDKAAYDDIIQAGSGLAALHKVSRGEPAFMPTVLCDKLSGQAIAYAVIAALFQRERGGGGQAIEVPMFETTAEFAYIEHLLGFAFEPPLGTTGYVRVVSPRRKPFRTADGYICILPYSDRNWRDFFDFVGKPEFKTDARFYPLTERVAHLETLYELIDTMAPTRSTAQWVDFCDEVSIPCMPVLSLDDLPDDPHMKAVGMFTRAEHPSEGSYKTIRAPVTFGSTPFRVRRHAPRLGEHTEEILKEIGAELKSR
jgi:crotonobetainyl-CoA:carnitine CoA-transferase CaiB-like acyl-CoA transferase